MASRTSDWPRIPLEEWSDTLSTLHLWSQIAGKVVLARAPLVNHWWDVTFRLTARGFRTMPVPAGARVFDVEFDFLDHRVLVGTSDGRRGEVGLSPRTVADFYRAFMRVLADLDVATPIRTTPSELADGVAFEKDELHASYDRDAVERFWRATLQADRVLRGFRERFLGKCSPVHFFWGSFDLAVTRFSGRRAEPPARAMPGFPRWANAESYSHECSSAGFWPGQGWDRPAFYSYAYPAPDGFSAARIAPGDAAYNDDFGQFLLPYEAVRTSRDPDAALIEFLQSTYEAAAELGGWDRASLERTPEELARLASHMGRA
jgi:hypothetical protein